MAPLHRDQDERVWHCRSVAAQLIARHGWELLPAEALASQAAALMDRLGDAPRAVLNAYSRALHTACSGVEGHDRQERGYLELYRYLLEIARWRLPAEAEELAQTALEMVFFGLGRCREPGAFLRFAIFQLQDATRRRRREQAHPVESLARVVSPEGLTLGELLVDDRSSNLDELALRQDLRERLFACAKAIERRHPRAGLQLAVVWLKYRAGLDDRTISARVGKPVNLVHVLRSRGLRLLREDQSLRDLAAEYGVGGGRPLQESAASAPFTSDTLPYITPAGGPASPRYSA